MHLHRLRETRIRKRDEKRVNARDFDEWAGITATGQAAASGRRAAATSAGRLASTVGTVRPVVSVPLASPAA
jgi:hypothetical protein